MRSPSYSANHAAKPDIETKQITLNDLEEGIKLSILADVERDQRLNDFKKSFDWSIEDAAAAQRESNRKRKADHESLNSFVEQACRERIHVMRSMVKNASSFWSFKKPTTISKLSILMQ